MDEIHFLNIKSQDFKEPGQIPGTLAETCERFQRYDEDAECCRREGVEFFWITDASDQRLLGTPLHYSGRANLR
jgi:hypothetical protein